jgi:Domain of unknown function (DUF4136)
MHLAPRLIAPAFEHLARWALLCAATLLAGCATTVNTQVSRFQAWSADLVPSRFVFLRAVDPLRELEQASYEALVEAELQRLGLSRALPGETARLQVDLSVGSQLEQRPYLQPVYQDLPLWRPAWRDAAGRIHPGYWARDPFGPRLVGQQPAVATLQVSTLRVRLLDAAEQPARAVYDATARHEAVGTLALPQVMPWLVRAAFEGFPGQNAEAREVRIDPRSGQVRPR